MSAKAVARGTSRKRLMFWFPNCLLSSRSRAHRPGSVGPSTGRVLFREFVALDPVAHACIRLKLVLLIRSFPHSSDNAGLHQLAVRNSDVLSRGGNGGRSSVSGVTAAVFGCSGFVGRYVAQALGSMGVRLVLPYRCDETDVQHLRTMGDLGMIVMQENFSVRDQEAVKRAVEGVDVVINVLGADHETWNYTFEDVHVKWAETLATACEDAKVERLLHFSALGASEGAPSRRLRTKHAGDEILKGALGDRTTVFKPAPITGPEDRLFRKFASQIKKMPFVPLVDGGKQKVQPIWIRDVAQCAVNALSEYESMGKEYELTGPETFTMKDLAKFSFETIRERPNTIDLPAAAAKLLAAPGDMLAANSPVRIRFAGISVDSVDETRIDLVQTQGTLSAADLGVKVHKVTEGLPIEFLRHYRSGGYDLGSVGAGEGKFTAPPHVG